jgi:hypothetical protein
MALDHAAREEHRAAGTGPLLVDDRIEAQFAGARGGDETGHARAGDDQVRLNDGLCSTYSSRTRSGPRTKTANVFAASTTRSTS